MRYLTDLRVQLIAGKTTTRNGALLTADADSSRFCSGGESARVDATMPWITEFHTSPIIDERSLIAGFARIRKNKIAAESMRTLFRLGGEYAHVVTTFVASGEHLVPPNRISSDTIVREGDLVFPDIGASWAGSFGDVARTTVCGKPSQRQQEGYTVVYRGLPAGIEQIGHGRTIGAHAIRVAAAEYGLADHVVSLFIDHGVGMGANEPPYIGEVLPGAPEYEFEPGMVFAVELLSSIPGPTGGGVVRLEKMVMITDGDAHVLSRALFDDDLLVD